MTRTPNTDRRRPHARPVRPLALCAAVGLVLALALTGPAGARQDGGRPLLGILAASETVSVAAPVDGVLEAVHYDLGDLVPEGAVVARLVGDVERASEELFRARAENRTRIEVARAEVGAARRTLEQRERLSRQGIVSQDDLQDAQVELSVLELALADARAEDRIAELEWRRAVAQVRQLEVSCPIEGRVVARHLAPGELLSRSGSPAVLDVARLHPLHVDLRVPLERWGELRPGQRARVRADLTGADWREATVDVVQPVADAASGTFVVRLSIPNEDLAWPAGARAEVELP